MVYLLPMAKQPKIKIYSTSWCPHCKAAKEFMTAKGIEYENIDVTTDEKLQREMIKKSGQMGVPVFDIEGKVIVGFDPDKLGEVLGIK